ncbi:substrate-binding periplasmic protein [Thalassotalea ganghwensis]
MVVLAIVLTPLSAKEKELAVGWELWYPYQYRNQNQELVGLDLDIFNAIVKHANLTVNYTELPWKRHLQYIKTGEMDVAMGASYTKEREEYAYFSLPYRVETVNLFVRKGNSENIKLEKLSDLLATDYMIGVEGGYYYGKAYQELIKRGAFRSHITEVLDLEQNIDLLMRGHLDGILVDPFTMQAFVKKYKMFDEFEKHSLEIYADDIQIMISKKSKFENLLPKINQAITELKSSGKLKQIIDNWDNIIKSENAKMAGL